MGIRPPEMQSGLGAYAPLLHGPEAASQSYVLGAAVLAAAGKISIGTADPTAAAFLGFAASPATGTTNADRMYNYVAVGTYVVLQLDDTLSTDAPGTHVLALADRFIRRGLSIDAATGLSYLDDNQTASNVLFEILEFIDPVGTVQGRVIAQRVL